MKMWQQKISAGALQFAILISVVIAVIVSAFILLSYTQQQFARQVNDSAKVLGLASSGFDYLKQKDITYGDSINFNLEGQENESITLHKSHWGIYDKVVSVGSRNGLSKTKIALVGGRVDSKNRLALHMEETNSPLVLVGNTLIQGNVVLPVRGVKPGSISGDYFEGNELIDGEINSYETPKPQVPDVKLKYIEKLLFGSVGNQDNLYIRSTEKIMSSSFTTDSKWLYSPGVIDLKALKIENNIIVKSDTLIRVFASTKANNILLIAPNIEISDNVQGTFQAFASKSIITGERTKLNYPSALVLMQENGLSIDRKREQRGVILGNNSLVLGGVFHFGKGNDDYQRAMIHLSEGSLVRGEVYSDQTVELIGSVEGSVYTHQFETKFKGSVYKNHLYNTTLSTENFPEVFTGVHTNVTDLNILQWVY
ncbi:hypothetical protein MED134_08426 [Dokdonia sp. MED134]|uniref:hypothetical protein n=1 Tax=Dokdonia sp. MED134 TaxID=313590 RepID=UPI000068CFB5|nr:hypothetical protein [Dokdonia sp. MED134]EAQ39502.1 hypothetical protein MED134_08426 [Dokdonia sp. MED134]